VPPALAPAALLAQAEQLRSAGKIGEALHCLDAAVALAPADAVIHCRRGLLLKALRRWDEALACFDRGIALQPDLAPAHMDRGNVLQEQNRLAEALAAYDRALQLQPRFPAALCNRGTVLHRLNRLDEAIAAYDAALAIAPGLDEARFNRSTVFNDAGRHAEALAGFEATLARHPDLAVAHWNEALCRLRLGDYARGWPKFEWRWRYADLGLRARDYRQPRWLGQQEIAGRTLLVHAEQGLGDTIQFCRYAPLLAARGARVILQVQRPLVPLLRTLAGGIAVIAEEDPLPPFDCHVPLLSLPLALGTTLPTIPAAVPYLHADPVLSENWARRLGPDRREARRLRVGLAWSGNPRQPNDRNRSMALSTLAPLCARDADFIALQPDIRPADAAALAAQGIRAFGAELHDFADTAALVANLDLVISVCTSCAHLAGALGAPVWVLLGYAADWRWLHGRVDSPWYPSARLFRQTVPGAWEDVVHTLGDHLQSVLDERS